MAWQCRLWQVVAREAGGGPSPGLQPRALTSDGRAIAARLTLLIVPFDPDPTTRLFQYIYRHTHDPAERYAATLRILAADHFQQPRACDDVMARLFGPGLYTSSGDGDTLGAQGDGRG